MAGLYSVYVLRNPKGRLYIGFTANLLRRVLQHKEDEGGWTKGKGSWKLVHQEEFGDRAQAMRREKALKSGRANEELRHQYGK